MARIKKKKLRGGLCTHCHRPVLSKDGNLVYSDVTAGYRVKHPDCKDNKKSNIITYYGVGKL